MATAMTAPSLTKLVTFLHLGSIICSVCVCVCVCVQLGVPCCNALLAYGEERYDDVSSQCMVQ